MSISRRSAQSATCSATSVRSPAANEFPAAFSPDGKYLAYLSDTTGRTELYVQPFPQHGPVVRVSKDGADTGVVQWIDHEIIFTRGRQVLSATVDTHGGSTGGLPKPLFA